jgi:transcription elongation factor GreA
LEDSLRRAKLIEHNGPSDVVQVGSRVTVVEEGSDEAETYSIVGPHEANPANGRISNESPIGSALLGAKRGQMVSIQIPAGEIRLRISEIA